MMSRVQTSILAMLFLTIVSTSITHAQKSIDFGTGGTVAGTLSFTDLIHPDTYFFMANAGESFQIDVSSIAFDATLRVVGPDASIALFNDDSVGTNPSLFFTAADTGSYIVIVSSFSGNAPGGDYTLTMGRFAATSTLSAGEPNESAQSGENITEDK